MEGNGDWEEDSVNDVECVWGEQGDKEGGVKMFTGEVVDEGYRKWHHHCRQSCVILVIYKC